MSPKYPPQIDVTRYDTGPARPALSLAVVWWRSTRFSDPVTPVVPEDYAAFADAIVISTGLLLHRDDRGIFLAAGMTPSGTYRRACFIPAGAIVHVKELEIEPPTDLQP